MSHVVEETRKGWYRPNYLPHFDDYHLIQAVTFRLANSFPRSVEEHLANLSPYERNEARHRKLIERTLDEGHGEPWLSTPKVAEIVVGSIHHLHAKGSQVFAFAVMPTHVHLLFQPAAGEELGDLLRNLKGYTAREANKILGRSGAFWAEDYYDRFIRDSNHFAACEAYIHANPVKARLCARAEDWPWSSALGMATSKSPENIATPDEV